MSRRVVRSGWLRSDTFVLEFMTFGQRILASWAGPFRCGAMLAPRLASVPIDVKCRRDAAPASSPCIPKGHVVVYTLTHANQLNCIGPGLWRPPPGLVVRQNSGHGL